VSSIPISIYCITNIIIIMTSNSGGSNSLITTSSPSFTGIEASLSYYYRHNPIYFALGWIRSVIYNRLILKMTIGWYQTVLEDVVDGSVILDVGIGTAGTSTKSIATLYTFCVSFLLAIFPAALLLYQKKYIFKILGALIACESLLRSKHIQVVGIDYDEQYIRQAAAAIKKAGLDDCIRVLPMNVYHADQPDQRNQIVSLIPSNSNKMEASSTSPPRRCFEAVYFSGSFSLLPDWTGALLAVSYLLKPTKDESNNDDDTTTKRSAKKIYITQTYQKQSSWILSWIKPWLRYITTIDFGQLVTVDRIQAFYQNHVTSTQNWELLRHQVIPNNVDNPMQAAYITIFQIIQQQP
jgi:hypothetical protein